MSTWAAKPLLRSLLVRDPDNEFEDVPPEIAALDIPVARCNQGHWSSYDEAEVEWKGAPPSRRIGTFVDGRASCRTCGELVAFQWVDERRLWSCWYDGQEYQVPGSTPEDAARECAQRLGLEEGRDHRIDIGPAGGRPHPLTIRLEAASS